MQIYAKDVKVFWLFKTPAYSDNFLPYYDKLCHNEK